MKKILSLIHRPARRVFIIGAISVFVMIIVSAFLYIGAGRMFDYYSATVTSERLLALSRPVCIGVCTGSLGLEYFCQKNENKIN